MELTDNMKGRILHALRSKGISQTALAQHMGLGKAWASKLLRERDRDGLKSLTPEQEERINEFLGIQLRAINQNREQVSGTATKLSQLAEEDDRLSAVLEDLLLLVDGPVRTPRYFTTKEMMRLGNQIIRLAHANEDKPGKVAREVLKLVTSD